MTDEERDTLLDLYLTTEQQLGETEFLMAQLREQILHRMKPGIYNGVLVSIEGQKLKVLKVGRSDVLTILERLGHHDLVEKYGELLLKTPRQGSSEPGGDSNESEGEK